MLRKTSKCHLCGQPVHLFDKLKKQEYIKDMTKALTAEQEAGLSYEVVQLGAGNPDNLAGAHAAPGEDKPVTLPTPAPAGSEQLLRDLVGPTVERLPSS